MFEIISAVMKHEFWSVERLLSIDYALAGFEKKIIQLYYCFIFYILSLIVWFQTNRIVELKS